MRRRTALHIALGVAIGSFLSGSLASAQDPPDKEEGRRPGFARGPGRMGPPPMPLMPHMDDRLIEELGLTEAQQEQIESVRESSREELRQAGRSLGEAHRAMNEAVLNGEDEASIREKAEALGAAFGDESVLRARVNSRIQEILTPEQKEELKKLRAEMKSRMERQMRRPRQEESR